MDIAGEPHYSSEHVSKVTDFASNTTGGFPANGAHRALPMKPKMHLQRHHKAASGLKGNGPYMDAAGSNALFESLKHSIGAFGARQTKLAKIIPY